MFTGIVEELGEIVGREPGEVTRLTIRGPRVTGDARAGDSIAVNGVCLTATAVADGGFSADAMNETLRRSSLGALAAGDRVNLELALRASDRLGGHMVQGHVDGLGKIAALRDEGFSRVAGIDAPAELLRYVVEKGSIAVNGVSLTVSALGSRSFEVSLIPETLERTTFGGAEIGSPVNLEVDVLAKYVERLVVR